jgi:hypothetical protein
MPTIRTFHDPCGEVETDVFDVVLFVAPDGTGTYRFECPNCYLMVKKFADQKIVSLLRAAEVRLVEVSPPGQEKGPSGPRFTRDDLIDFHVLLQTDSWFELLKREVGS